MIQAQVNSEDGRARATFDASGYFQQATSGELAAFADCGYIDCLPAAEWARGDLADVEDVFIYARLAGVGIECTIDAADAAAWLAGGQRRAAA